MLITLSKILTRLTIKMKLKISATQTNIDKLASLSTRIKISIFRKDRKLKVMESAVDVY